MNSDFSEALSQNEEAKNMVDQESSFLSSSSF